MGQSACRAAFAAAVCLAGCGESPVAAPDSPAVQGRPAAAYTVSAGESGFYVLTNSRLQIGDDQVGEVELRVSARHASLTEAEQPAPAVLTRLGAGEAFDFDTFLGYLVAGDTVHVDVASADGKTSDKTQTSYKVERAPAIPVSVFPEDVSKPAAIDAPAGWALMTDIAAGRSPARLLGWGNPANAGEKAFELKGAVARVRLDGIADRETIAAFRVPQSGYYALHNAWAAAGANGGAEARIYVGHSPETQARSTTRLTAGSRVSLDTELGYIEKGKVVYVAFAAPASTTVDFATEVVEWAPRRAPLRVRRGEDGLFDVLEPADPRRAIDIPMDHWITVPAREGDATEAIRKAIVDAVALQKEGEYAGVRLEAGRKYVLASNQDTGTIFEIKGLSRLVFDGNGATLYSNSPDAQRRGITPFHHLGKPEDRSCRFRHRVKHLCLHRG